MKRILILAAAVVLALSLSCRAAAAQTEVFEEEISRLESSLPDELRQEMQKLGADSIAELSAEGLAFSEVFDYLTALFSDNAREPLFVMIMLLSVTVFTALAEGYVTSLRYTDMREIMGVASALFIAAVIAPPIARMAEQAVSVMKGTSEILLAYVPVMAGIMAFSGRAITSAGYYAAVVGVSQMISKLSSGILLPMLNLFLSLSISSGVCGSLNLSKLTEMISKWIKWLLAFAMSVFTAVLGLNTALSATADGASGKAARFALSSLIPLIGSAVSEAYSTIQGSLTLLRSGMGVFVILAVIISFLPLLIKTVLFSLAVQIVRMTGDALGASSSAGILNALSSFLSMFIALLIGSAVVFVISSAVILRVGGVS